MNTGPPSQSSWRAHGFHSSKPSRKRQPPRVTSQWRLLEESLVPQSSRTLESSTRISHTHNGSRKACVWRERALTRQVCCSNGQEGFLARDGGVFIAHTPKTSRWKDSVHLAVRPQCNSRSDRPQCNGYFSNQIFDRWRSWRSDRPWWRSDRQSLFWSPKIYFFG